MEDVPIPLIVLFFSLLFLSAFFSSSETALSSANKIRLQSMVDNGSKGADKALKIINSFDEALSTILIGNNLVNIAAATISAQVSTMLFGPNLGVFISTFVVTLLVLIFGEIMPKSLAKEYAETFSAKIAPIILFLMILAAPFNKLLLLLKQFVYKLIGSQRTDPSVTEEELKMMVNISEEEGVIDHTERELVHRSFDFNEITISEVFRPRTDMITIDINENAEEIKNIFIEQRFSRIPVYEESIDNIVGILYEREFFTAFIEGSVDIRSLIKPPILVVESMKIHKLLPKLQREKSHIAIVIDEYGGTAGLITLEDILEELVGEIYDEHDAAEPLVVKTGINSYSVHGDYPLDETMDLLNSEVPDSSYHSLGGWISEQYERIPETEETLYYQDTKFKILESDDRRVYRVQVSKVTKEDIPEGE
ncbi:hemolysin family protein [Alkalicoccus daliensis]|uniref:Hemolysin, contains CBS domains n=1 Tax=Alkalicoccus daliensis TaxID=745820 RepID=A0A1H0HV91_9BACI|nr:hemolysin family protein [Alkalicoccus daliensis]SDO23073.1 Hemolysin, contains CBS domains [Alkalicoccus daliensis]